jgi:hypothetical protein
MIELIDYLRQFGLVPIALPSTGYKPFQLLLENKIDKSCQSLGKEVGLTDLFTGAEAKELYSKYQKIPAMQGVQNARWNVQGRLSDGGITGLSGKIDAARAAQQDVIFVFEGAQLQEVSKLNEVEAYLNNAKIEGNNPLIKRLLNNELYIITTILKVKKFAVAVANQNSAQLNLSANVLQDLLNGRIQANAKDALHQIYHYEDKEPIAIAIKAAKIQRLQTTGEWLLGKKGVFSIDVNHQPYIVRGEAELNIEYLDL